MLKLLGAFLVLFSCGTAGVYLAEEKKRRLKSLKKLQGIFTALQGEIRYGGTPLKEAIETAAGAGQAGERAVSAVFLKIAEKMEEKSYGSFSEIWEREWSLGAKETALSGEDLERLFRAGESLGYLDRETQLNCLKVCLLELGQSIAAEETAIHEKVRLCRWLGALAGVFICILMV